VRVVGNYRLVLAVCAALQHGRPVLGNGLGVYSYADPDRRVRFVVARYRKGRTERGEAQPDAYEAAVEFVSRLKSTEGVRIIG